MKGFLVCFEGLDGAGKTSQVDLLRDELNRGGVDFSIYSYHDRESVYGKRITSFLKGGIKVGAAELFLLYLSDMVKDKDIVESDLKNGKVVIMDRYFFSTIAYQSAGGFSYDNGKKVEDIFGLTKPDLVFYIDAPVDVALKRKKTQTSDLTTFDKNREYLEKVKGMYDKLFEERYGAAEWVRLDANEPVDILHEKIFDKVSEELR